MIMLLNDLLLYYSVWTMDRSTHRLSCDRQKKRGKHTLSKSRVAENQNRILFANIATGKYY